MSCFGNFKDSDECDSCAVKSSCRTEKSRKLREQKLISLKNFSKTLKI